MSTDEISAKQGGDDTDHASSPKIIIKEAIIKPESSKQDKDNTDELQSDTKLTNQVVEPMNRCNDNAAATAISETNTNVVMASEVKTNTNGVRDFVKKIARDDSMDFPKMSKCCVCCACCAGCCACLLCIPCMAIAMVLNCLLCPVNCAINCCCPSKAQPIVISFDDFQSMFNSLSD